MRENAQELISSSFKNSQTILDNSHNFNDKTKKLRIYRPIYEIRVTLKSALRCHGTDMERITIAKTLTDSIYALREAIESIENPNRKPFIQEAFILLERDILDIVRLVGAAPTESKGGSFARTDGTLRVINARELALKYNGAGKNPAYIAVGGVVYDVTGCPQWHGGIHHGQFAGREYTTEFARAHSANIDFLRKNAPIAGIFSED